MVLEVIHGGKSWGKSMGVVKTQRKIRARMAEWVGKNNRSAGRNKSWSVGALQSTNARDRWHPLSAGWGQWGGGKQNPDSVARLGGWKGYIKGKNGNVRHKKGGDTTT